MRTIRTERERSQRKAIELEVREVRPVAVYSLGSYKPWQWVQLFELGSHGRIVSRRRDHIYSGSLCCCVQTYVKECQGQKQRDQLGASIQVRDDTLCNQNDSTGSGEKWSDYWFILKTKSYCSLVTYHERILVTYQICLRERIEFPTT